MAAHGGEVIAEVLPRLLASIADMDEDLVILLDDFHFLRDADCHTPGGVPRRAPAPAGSPRGSHPRRSRAADRLAPGDRSAGRRSAPPTWPSRPRRPRPCWPSSRCACPSGSVRDLVQRTEGWAAGLYLATLSMSGRSDPDEFVREVSDGNRFIGDYLTEEVLAGLSDEVREFIRTMSILDRFSAPLADYMTGSTQLRGTPARARTQQPVPDPAATRSAGGSGSTTCSPLRRAASWSWRNPSGCPACTRRLRAGSATTATSTRP